MKKEIDRALERLNGVSDLDAALNIMSNPDLVKGKQGLIKTVIIDKNGHRRVVWKKAGGKPKVVKKQKKVVESLEREKSSLEAQRRKEIKTTGFASAGTDRKILNLKKKIDNFGVIDITDTKQPTEIPKPKKQKKYNTHGKRHVEFHHEDSNTKYKQGDEVKLTVKGKEITGKFRHVNVNDHSPKGYAVIRGDDGKLYERSLGKISKDASGEPNPQEPSSDKIEIPKGASKAVRGYLKETQKYNDLRDILDKDRMSIQDSDGAPTYSKSDWEKMEKKMEKTLEKRDSFMRDITREEYEGQIEEIEGFALYEDVVEAAGGEVEESTVELEPFKGKIEFEEGYTKEEFEELFSNMGFSTDKAVDSLFSGMKGRVLIQTGGGNDDFMFEYESGFGYTGKEVTAIRNIFKTGEGKLICDNYSLEVEEKGKGIGTEILKNQIKGLKSLGVEVMTTEAVGGLGETEAGYNGYYTWGRLGYIPDNFDEVKENMIKYMNIDPVETKDDLVRLKESNTLAELLSSEEGRKTMKMYGVAWKGEFELSDGSDSMIMFDEYLKSKKDLQKAENVKSLKKSKTKQAEEFPIEELDSAEQGWEKRALDRINAKQDTDEVSKALDILTNL